MQSTINATNAAATDVVFADQPAAFFDFDPVSHFQEYCESVAMAVLLDSSEINLCGIGLGYTNFAITEADELFGFACLEEAAARGDQDAASELENLCEIEEDVFAEIEIEFEEDGYRVSDLSDEIFGDVFSFNMDSAKIIFGIADFAAGINEPDAFDCFLKNANEMFEFLRAGCYIDPCCRVTLLNKRTLL